MREREREREEKVIVYETRSCSLDYPLSRDFVRLFWFCIVVSESNRCFRVWSKSAYNYYPVNAVREKSATSVPARVIDIATQHITKWQPWPNPPSAWPTVGSNGSLLRGAASAKRSSDNKSQGAADHRINTTVYIQRYGSVQQQEQQQL